MEEEEFMCLYVLRCVGTGKPAAAACSIRRRSRPCLIRDLGIQAAIS